MLRIVTMIMATLIGSSAFAAPLTEQQKIDALLNAFDTPGITLVRNGEEHDGAWAKQHFTEKLKAASPAPATAKDFITNIASTSSHTGKPYMIKTADGQTVKSGIWLRAKLAKIITQDSASANDTK